MRVEFPEIRPDGSGTFRMFVAGRNIREREIRDGFGMLAPREDAAECRPEEVAGELEALGLGLAGAYADERFLRKGFRPEDAPDAVFRALPWRRVSVRSGGLTETVSLAELRSAFAEAMAAVPGSKGGCWNLPSDAEAAAMHREIRNFDKLVFREYLELSGRVFADAEAWMSFLSMADATPASHGARTDFLRVFWGFALLPSVADEARLPAAELRLPEAEGIMRPDVDLVEAGRRLARAFRKAWGAEEYPRGAAELAEAFGNPGFRFFPRTPLPEVSALADRRKDAVGLHMFEGRRKGKRGDFDAYRMAEAVGATLAEPRTLLFPMSGLTGDLSRWKQVGSGFAEELLGPMWRLGRKSTVRVRSGGAAQGGTLL